MFVFISVRSVPCLSIPKEIGRGNLSRFKRLVGFSGLLFSVGRFRRKNSVGMKPSKSVPQFLKGRPGTPKEIARKFKSTQKAPYRRPDKSGRSGLGETGSSSLDTSLNKSSTVKSKSTPSSRLFGTSGTGASTKSLTPIELQAQGMEWVPPSRYEKGYWRKKKRRVPKLRGAAMESLTRPRTSQGISIPPGSSATGRWLRPGGGRFSLGKPKSEIDWVILRAKQTPAPNQYAGVAYKWGTGGIKISDANPKSEVDWVIYRSKRTPAPNAYRPPPIASSGMSGGRFSTAWPKSYLDWVKYRASQTPGPSEYKTDLCPNYPKSSNRWISQLLKDKKSKLDNMRRRKRSY